MIDLPSKKMARWKILIAALCIVQTSYGQNHGCIAAEMTEIIRNANARIRIGYAFSSDWTAEARSSFPAKGSRVELSVRHWPKGCYSGTYISSGITSTFRKDTDMLLGIGYCLPLWKRLGLDIGYMLTSLCQATLPERCIRREKPGESLTR